MFGKCMHVVADYTKKCVHESKNFGFDLNFLKGPSIDFLVVADFVISKVPKKCKSMFFIGAHKFRLAPISGVLWSNVCQRSVKGLAKVFQRSVKGPS